MNAKPKKTTKRWLVLPVVMSSTAVLSATVFAQGQVAGFTQQIAGGTQQAAGRVSQVAGKEQGDNVREVGHLNHQFVGGKTRVGVGIDTEFDGTADISHIFSESRDTATSGDLWVGFDVSGDDKGISGGGAQLNHHWVSRDEQGRPLRVNKVFGAYDQDANNNDKVTVGYGQEIDNGFWEAYVGKGLSDKRRVGVDVFEKAFERNVGGRVGTYLGNDLRVSGGLDYAWDDERAANEDKPTKLTVSAGVDKYFTGTPHSVSLDVAASRREGGLGKKDSDTRGNLSYRYHFGSDVYQSDKQIKRVRVERPAVSTPVKYVKKTVKVPYKQAYKKPVKVKACQLVKSTVELGSDTFFNPGSSALLPSAKSRLNDVVAQIRRTGYEGNIRITGNTCDVGTVQHNQILSEKRAKAVKKYLRTKGFSSSELLARGLGETRPKYPNTPVSRHKNRRVDIEYVTKDGTCKEGYKTVYKTAYKTAYRNEVRNVKVGGVTRPAGVEWKTEVVDSEPLWVKRALRTAAKHNRYVDTYRTAAGAVAAGTGTGESTGNVAPVAGNMSVTTDGSTIAIDVINSSYDANGDELTVTGVEGASNGLISIVNNQVVYTPNSGFVGQDSFSYTISDGELSATGVITVIVNGQTASTDTGSTDSGSTDSGSTDSGSTDSGSTDSGSADSGSTDSGSTDSGSTDSGSTDSGSTGSGSGTGTTEFFFQP